jgi:hypothetical protein
MHHPESRRRSALGAEAVTRETQGPAAARDGFVTYPGLDAARWSPARLPLPTGGEHIPLDPDAELAVGEGEVRVTIPRFSLSHDTFQPAEVRAARAAGRVGSRRALLPRSRVAVRGLRRRLHSASRVRDHSRSEQLDGGLGEPPRWRAFPRVERRTYTAGQRQFARCASRPRWHGSWFWR